MSDTGSRIASRLRFDRLSAIATVVWLTLVGLLVFWPAAPHWPLRMIVVTVAIVAGWRLWRERPLMWLSPLLLVPLVILIFFSLLPALYMSPQVMESFRPNFQQPIAQYLSGSAELIVLQFAAFLLTTGLMLRPNTTPRSRFVSRAPDQIGCIVLLTIVALVALLAACQLWPDLGLQMQSGIGRHVLHGISPIMSFCVAVLTWLAADKKAWLPVLLVAGGAGCIALFGLANAKAPTFVAVSCLLFYTVLHPSGFRRLFWGAAVTLVTVAVSLLVLAELRSSTVSNYLTGKDPRGASALADALVYKLVFRQAESIGCFANAVERRLLVPPEQPPYYFLNALVPRVLWEGKPNLSQGDRLATDYCDIAPSSVYGPEIVHSSSVTLLGEPIIASGLAGLVVAQAALSVVLALATAFLLGSGAGGAIFLAALLPWLVDFDQSLSLYVANAVKMSLYMSPGVFLLVSMNRRLLFRSPS